MARCVLTATFVVDSSPVSDKSEEERLSSSGPELLETVLPELK